MAGGGGVKRTASPTRAISPPPLKRKVESTITKKAVSSFFTPASQKKPEQITWRIVNNSAVIGKYTSELGHKNSTEKPRIAAFDLDSTLVSTASGNTFPRNGSDWKWWHDTVPGKLKELNDNGILNSLLCRYYVVVVTNQKKISLKKDLKKGQSDSKSLVNFKERASAVMKQLDIPLSVYAATEDDEYRKPRTGLWKEMLDDYDFDVSGVNLAESVFVGDAAGRPNDHSMVDRGFALNVKVPFKTPEEFFLNADPEPLVEPFDPTKYLQAEPTDDVAPPFSRQSPLELVIFCGSPGAGKSSFYWEYLEPLKYERVNQDLLKTCIKVAKEHLAAGRSVVVDNTNADPETRSHWVEVAKEFNVPIRCVYFTASPALCRHNNAVRAANQTLNPESRTLLPGIAFGDFLRRFKEPSMEEGFQDIIRVEFRFRGDESAKRLWGQYWV
ncbi:putative DNA 3'-phosphatase Tpp1 [Aspergillus neoniger CBS 115656]|uniref:Polynucleotide kinase 3'-phosphatase n=1 Tax=Aspergillus neoniger (strain CBS 115656) TaxID=1448310 RepID=A0A318YNC2_ASPNB|nr:polynucleotide kinase 3'-phosphatase [Aspergillus neoniger CBS 115656]PYH29708.1 polynucleotide kinase 3'-phosphatase [Aspergillus neoniger CBS 115656]